MALCRIDFVRHTVGSPRPWGWLHEGHVTPIRHEAVLALLYRADSGDLNSLIQHAEANREAAIPITAFEGEAARYRFIAPAATGQEVWAAGVTYESSKFARMAESPEGSDFYARVYAAERPELFFKALPRSVVGPNDCVRIRADSAWNVPEPELTALIAADGRILGYTIGNDMSSRSIEGENPLYLPQAKVYRGSCAIGPAIVPASALDARNLEIRLTIERGGSAVYEGATSTARMRRTVDDLAKWLFRENEFPAGVLLLTGTGIIPPDDFTLQPGDVVTIAIAGIGELRNTVTQASTHNGGSSAALQCAAP